MNNTIFQALRSKRNAEQSYEEAVTRVNELTTINVNLSSSKSKIEQELSQLASDYDEVTKELRVSYTKEYVNIQGMSQLLGYWIHLIQIFFVFKPRRHTVRLGLGDLCCQRSDVQKGEILLAVSCNWPICQKFRYNIG